MARESKADVDRPIEAVLAAVAELADSWAADRPSRQSRRHLDPADFQAIADSGFLRTVVPVEHGGLWADTATSARPVIGLLRTLAQGDPSVALVAAMHPAVVSFWLMSETASTEPSPGSAAAWTAQRAAVFATAMAGHQWGTITSEPGSGGDIARTRSVAVAVDDSDAGATTGAGATTELEGAVYRISGDKHFGSGSGISSFM
ncbi:MAG: hypothetical protein OER95_09110, partial [Acidimicrobiia bacterium]|nr:hypothetical protein [Acidimicrobiia bacterium]